MIPEAFVRPALAADPYETSGSDGDAGPRPPEAAVPGAFAFQRLLAPSTTANLLATFAIAALLVGLFLASKPYLRGTHLGTLLFERGWVQYAIMICASWSLGILGVKMLEYVLGQRRVFGLGLHAGLPSVVGPQDAAAACRGLIDLYASQNFLQRSVLRRSLLFARVYRALEQAVACKNAQETSVRLESLAVADANASESSFAMMKVLVWAIPIFGFIGTVEGIGDAVNGFSDAIRSANDLEIIKKALGAVTAGLAVAFDTTLLALVMSIVIMVPMSTLQLVEGRLLGAVDDYVNDELIGRFGVKLDAPEDSTNLGLVARAVARALAPHEAVFRQRAEEIRLAGDHVAQATTSGWQAVHEKLQDDMRRHLDELARAMLAVRESGLESQRALRTVQADQAHSIKEVTELVVQNHRAVAERAERMQEQMLGAVGAVQLDQARSIKEVTELVAQHQRAAVERSGRSQEQMLNEVRGVLREVTGIAGKVASTSHAGIDELGRAGQQILGFLIQGNQTLLSQSRDLQDGLARAAAEQLEELRHAQERLLSQSGEHLSETLSVGRDLVAALETSAKGMADRIDESASLSAHLQQLYGSQQMIATNLDALARATMLQDTLAGVQSVLAGLGPAVSRIAELQASNKSHKWWRRG
jgi:biopolymer transport protein ExbB/TolQ